jgi:hypothetical protein
MYGAKQVEARGNLKLWLIGLHDCADNCNIHVLCTDVVGRRDHGDVDVYTPSANKMCKSARGKTYHFVD